MSRIIAHCTRRVRKLSYQRRHEGACYLQSTSMATTAISRIVATIQVPDSHISLVVGPDGRMLRLTIVISKLASRVMI